MEKQDHISQRQIDLMDIEARVDARANDVLIGLRIAWELATTAPRDAGSYAGDCALDELEYLTSKVRDDMDELIVQLKTAREINRELS